MSRTTAVNNDFKTRADRLMAESFVFNTTEAVQIGGAENRRLYLGDDKFDESVLEGWRTQGIKAVLIPHGLTANPGVTDLNAAPDYQDVARRVFARWSSFIASHTDEIMLVTKSGDFEHAQRNNKIAFLLGTHSGGELFRCVDDVDYFHSIGLRSALITCFGQNRCGTSVEEGEGRDGGLTRYGHSIIERMNEVGMAVDVSHCGLKTRREAIEASSKPVLITHGNVSAVCPTPRNNSDEMLKALATTGGVIGLMFWRPMVSTAEEVTVEQVVDHFDHASQVIGAQHIGLGLEVPMQGFDTCTNLPTTQVSYVAHVTTMDVDGLCHERRIWTLVEALLCRGYSDEDINGFLGGNFERAFKEIFTL